MQQMKIGETDIKRESDRVDVKFKDGAGATFPEVQPNTSAAATAAGYIDPKQYCMEHAIAMVWLAVQQGKKYSTALWNLAHSKDQHPTLAPNDEESQFANAMLLYLNTGKQDDGGLLNKAFGAMLPTMTARLWRILRDSSHKANY